LEVSFPLCWGRPHLLSSPHMLGSKKYALRFEIENDSVLGAQLLQARFDSLGWDIALDNSTGIRPDGLVIADGHASPQGNVVLRPRLRVDTHSHAVIASEVAIFDPLFGGGNHQRLIGIVIPVGCQMRHSVSSDGSDNDNVGWTEKRFQAACIFRGH